MTAAEVIEQIKRLPAEEQRKVTDYLRDKCESMSLRDMPVAKTDMQYMDRGRASQLRERIFQKNDELFRMLAQ